jgi:hypothetical protein
MTITKTTTRGQPTRQKATPAVTGSIDAALRVRQKGGARMTTTTATTTTTTGMRQRRDPWDANYASSLETQRIIKFVASASSSSSWSPRDGNPLGANAMLCALLDANPRLCNAANVVCALTSSSRLLGRQRQCRGGCDDNDEAEAEGEGKGEEEREGGRRRQRYATSLMRTILIFNKHFTSRPGVSSAQQLCNAAWSIARHVRLLPLELMQRRSSRGQLRGQGQ